MSYLKKRKSQTLVVLALLIVLERDSLTGPSLIDVMATVSASGQELETLDFSESGFNYYLGEE